MSTTSEIKLTPPRASAPSAPAEPADPTEAESAEPIGNPRQRHFVIGGPQVNEVTAGLPDDQRSIIREFHAHAWENDIPLKELGKLVKYDYTVLHRVFTGKYEGSLANVCDAFRRFLEIQSARTVSRKLAFIETETSRRIGQVCTQALELQRVGLIFGDSQIGKTESLLHHARTHNHGETIYTEVPTGGALCNFLAALLRSLRGNPNQSERKMREDIFNAVDDRMLLIFDEVHRAIPTVYSIRPIRIIEFIRELHDAKRCGVVLSATNVFREVLEQRTGPVSGILRQMERRRFCTLNLPATPTEKDLNAFAAAYGLPPATGTALALQKDVIQTEALGMWLSLLRIGKKLAGKRKEGFRWSHVAAAKAGLDQLADPKMSLVMEGGAE